MHYAITAESNHTFAIDADVSFHGATADLALDGDRRFVIDLASGAVSAAP